MVWVAMVADSSDIIGVYSSLALAARDVMKHATSYDGIYLDRLTSYSYYDISKTAFFYFSPINEADTMITTIDNPYRVEIQGVHLNELLF